MQEVNVGIIGLGNVGMGTLGILTENASQIALKLGFQLRVKALCSPSIHSKKFHTTLDRVLRTPDWQEVVEHPEVDIVAELVGGTVVAREIIDAAIRNRKSVVTANKELMALCGAEIWDRAIAAGINLAMEASVAGGIPIHTVLREGISGDRVVALYGILNGTSNYILTEIEKRGVSFEQALQEAQGLENADRTVDGAYPRFPPAARMTNRRKTGRGGCKSRPDRLRRSPAPRWNRGYLLCVARGMP